MGISWGQRLGSVVALVLLVPMMSGCALLGARQGDGSYAARLILGQRAVLEGWTAEPTTPDPVLLADAIAPCLVADGIAPALVDAPVLQDQRGPDTAAFVWVRGTEEADCLASRDAAGIVTATQRSFSRSDEIGVGLPVAPTGLYCGPPTMLTGNVAPDVDRVTVETAFGRSVTASVGHRRFAAWWPAVDGPVSITTMTVDGRRSTLIPDLTCPPS